MWEVPVGCIESSVVTCVFTVDNKFDLFYVNGVDLTPTMTETPNNWGSPKTVSFTETTGQFLALNAHDHNSCPPNWQAEMKSKLPVTLDTLRELPLLALSKDYKNRKYSGSLIILGFLTWLLLGSGSLTWLSYLAL